MTAQIIRLPLAPRAAVPQPLREVKRVQSFLMLGAILLAASAGWLLLLGALRLIGFLL